MMQSCTARGCNNWAQWRVSSPDPSNPKVLMTVALLCQLDKDKVEKKDELRFHFMGATPSGLNCS